MMYSNHIPNLDLAWQVYRSGSLRAAAESVGLSHTTLGRRIRKLESDLSLTLFIRHGRKIQPTPTAESLLPKYFERIQALADVMHDDYKERTREAIRIDAALVSLYPALIPRITAFRSQNPSESYMLADTRNANITLRVRPSKSARDHVTHRGPVLLWSLVAHRDLRYDLRKETLFITENAPRAPNSALVQYGAVERLGSIHAVVTAVKAQLGLGWIPVNSGLLDPTLTEASGEHERIAQSVTLELSGDNAHIGSHTRCQAALIAAIGAISDESLAESGQAAI